MAANQLVIAIVCPQSFQDKLNAALKIQIDAYPNSLYNFALVFVNSIYDLTQVDEIKFDFVALFVDTNNLNSVETCTETLQRLSTHVVAIQTLLVNGTCNSGELAVAKKCMHLADEFHVPAMNAEVNDLSSCTLTAARLLKLTLVTSGTSTGIPTPIPLPPN